LLHPIDLEFLPTFGGYEWLIILFIILILFGAKKLPELARGMGEAVKEFRRASREVEVEEVSKLDEDRLNKVAKELGINIEGKNREEIVKEIVEALSKAKQSSTTG